MRKKKENGKTYITFSGWFGSALAMTISWSANHSIMWAIIHGVFSWFYVLYYAMTQ